MPILFNSLFGCATILLQIHLLKHWCLWNGLILLQGTCMTLHLHRQLKDALIKLIDLDLEELNFLGFVIILLLQHLYLGVPLLAVLLRQCRAQLMHPSEHAVFLGQLFDLGIHLCELAFFLFELFLECLILITYMIIFLQF